ncbi:MAG: hypothetical protein WCK02_12420 [Bacteroidota bacterium]
MKKSFFVIIAAMLFSVTAKSQSEKLTCKMLNITNFCVCRLDSMAVLPNYTSCVACYNVPLSCEEINKMQSIKALQLTITGEKLESIRFKSHLKNIYVIKKDGTKVPIIGVYFPGSEYVGSKTLRAIKYIVGFNSDTRHDLLFAFPNVEVGDVLVFNKKNLTIN